MCDTCQRRVTRRRLEVAFRKAKFGTRGDGNYLSMTYSEFLEALSLVSMMAYSTRK